MIQNTYEPLMCTTTLIQYPEKQDQHATGFFYNYNGSTYLITNRHVLEHENDQPKEISIRFRSYSDIADTTREEVSLYNDDFPRWLIHPIYPSADIAALPLDQRLNFVNDEDRLTGSLALSSDAFVGPDIMIRGGTGTRTFGYPDGYVDTNSQFPIARDGMIASPYGNWFDNQPQFLVDGVMGDGMSGSPVFTEQSIHHENMDGSATISGSTTFLIGIHSGDYREAHAPRDSDLNINHVWYAELIESLFIINGLSEYVEQVSFDSESGILGDEIEKEEKVRDIISKLTTWGFFDPEYNRPDSGSNLLDEKIEIDEISSLLSLIEDDDSNFI